MGRRRTLLGALLAGLTTAIAGAAERPNILWITAEDNSAHWLGCYGNAEACTPRLDALAAEGFRFTRAHANAPVCAVARSTILNGAFAVSQGTQHMRSRHPIPARFRPYVAYLREAGYHCTNNAKTDYNFKGDDRAIWDECSGRAHYRNRPAGKPFLAVFNLTVSHESCLFPETVRANRARGLIPRTPRLDPARVAVPSHLPDLPQVRSDIAVCHDCITALDTAAGKLLDELGAAGLATPIQMQGRAFLGPERAAPPADAVVFLFADRIDELYGMRRGITDGRWRYIRCFTPHQVAAPHSFYQFGQPGWRAWRAAWQGGRLAGRHRRLWEAPQPVEQLCDTAADPWEVCNLAGEPAHAARRAAMRGRLRQTMAEARDTDLVPEPMFAELAAGRPVADDLASDRFDLPGTLELAFLASARDPAAVPALTGALGSADPVKRYRAAQGCVILGSAAALAAELDRAPGEHAALLALNAFMRLDATSRIPAAWLAKVRADRQVPDYLARFAVRLAQPAE